MSRQNRSNTAPRSTNSRLVRSRLGTIVLAVTIVLNASPEVAASDDAERSHSDAVAAIVEDFRACVAEAVAVTTPDIVPDKDVRRVAFETILESCEGSRDAKLRGLAAEAEMEAITDSIIRGAKDELGIRS